MPTAIASAPITGSVESVPVLRWTSWVGFKDIPHPKSLVQQVPCCHLTARKPMDVRETATIIVAVSGRNNRSLWNCTILALWNSKEALSFKNLTMRSRGFVSNFQQRCSAVIDRRAFQPTGRRGAKMIRQNLQ